MNGFISTKTSMKTGDIYYDDNMFISGGFEETQVPKNESELRVLVHKDMKNSDKAFDKEHFAFYLEIQALNQKEKAMMYQEIANILAKTTVSVLGLEK